MKIYVPNYYTDFACKASKCKHNCCIGWEIDIDKETYNQYELLGGALGEKIKNSIEYTDNTFSFRLDGQNRCPHLDNKNLCTIISELGENALCQICKDHPRFKNYFTDRVEIGLGLCCEEAARIILTCEESFSLIDTDENTKSIATNEETEFFTFRNNILNTICDRNTDIDLRIKKILCENKVHMPDISINRWFGLLSTLEFLDDGWHDILKNAVDTDYESSNVLTPVQIEQLFVYFIFRHLPRGFETMNYRPAIAFSYLSVLIINELAGFMGYTDLKGIIEICRMYSSEIEYSDENLDLIFELLSR